MTLEDWLVPVLQVFTDELVVLVDVREGLKITSLRIGVDCIIKDIDRNGRRYFHIAEQTVGLRFVGMLLKPVVASLRLR